MVISRSDAAGKGVASSIGIPSRKASNNAPAFCAGTSIVNEMETSENNLKSTMSPNSDMMLLTLLISAWRSRLLYPFQNVAPTIWHFVLKTLLLLPLQILYHHAQLAETDRIAEMGFR